ncbi:hypothetical protein HNP46_006575 [Pseudomonas nitritireducens]|uniref:Uncharacterized protein n=1 Tax=Pseudomonas nitroreducens TaxID=46680 RepID=A0A7W7KRT8_PSENT|nr:hypothetical protein [Pseudomonas nitritireducens]MBB4867656.1 hypothetical protein [Pseudomonas nitritireducens]
MNPGSSLLAIDSIRNAAGRIISGRDFSLTALTGDAINERSITLLDLINNNDRNESAHRRVIGGEADAALNAEIAGR